MQPGVTVVLATVWLAVCVVGTPALHLSRPAFDQYSPLAPHHREVYRGVEGQLDWKDQNPAENQPFDLSIGPRRSISTSTEHTAQSSESRYFKKDYTRTGNRDGYDFSSLTDDESHNSIRPKFTDEKVDNRRTKGPSSREPTPFELKDSFVADDTFQDQGPGSVEIYKLDLFREKSLLSPTPITKFLAKSKSKIPKKSSYADWKTKTMDYKATSPKMFYKQSNSFDDIHTEIPPNTYPFGVGGVPELQVGCEGLEASDHKHKRSIMSPKEDRRGKEAADPWANVTPVSLDLDYEYSLEDDYEEMDELVRLKKLEAATQREKQNRGDIQVSLHSDSSNNNNPIDKLPVRGDLGNASVNYETLTTLHDSRKETKGASLLDTKEGKHFVKQKRSVPDQKSISNDKLVTNHGRKILWFGESNDKNPSKKSNWGFGEDEGVVSSDELQTVSERRRQGYERRRQEEERRRQEDIWRQENERRRQEDARRRNHIYNRTNSDADKIREDHEALLKQREREEEERQRRIQESQKATPNRRQWEDEYRQRLQEEERRRNEVRRRQEPEAIRRRHEFSQSSPGEEEAKRQRERQEEQRRREEEMRARQQQELDRRNAENRRREWMLKRREQEEREGRRQEHDRIEIPSNLLYPARGSPNVSRPHETESERKLREYMQRNRPIKVNNSVDQQREEENRRRIQEEQRRRLEEQRKLQEYIQRNKPVRVPKVNVSNDGNWLEYRRPVTEVRPNTYLGYQRPENGRRDHGPSAPSNFNPWGYTREAWGRDAGRRMEEERVREREKQEEEERRREALRREQEVRRMQSRRYEEERRRLEAARLEAERRAKEHVEEETRRSQAGRSRSSGNTRPNYENRQRFEEHRRRQDTSLIPANLLLNDSRKPIELERQRQEQERRRIEAEQRRQEESRAKEARDNEERVRAIKEQWMRQEEARLNVLPVSARIIIRPGPASSKPTVLSRGNFDNDVDFLGLNPYGEGIQVPNFPAPATRRPPAKSPPPCVWAVVQCCPSNTNRLVACFESLGCPGINWDPNPCRGSITQAARKQVMKFYDEEEDRI